MSNHDWSFRKTHLQWEYPEQLREFPGIVNQRLTEPTQRALAGLAAAPGSL